MAGVGVPKSRLKQFGFRVKRELFTYKKELERLPAPYRLVPGARTAWHIHPLGQTLFLSSVSAREVVNQETLFHWVGQLHGYLIRV
jgi:hypothetical protein